MPRAEEERLRYSASEPVILKLLQKLARDGASWADAEVRLARSEAGSRVRRYVWAAALAAAGLIFLNVALVILAQAATAALTPQVGGPVAAGLAVATILLMAMIFLAQLARRLLHYTSHPQGLILGWLAGGSVSKGKSA